MVALAAGAVVLFHFLSPIYSSPSSVRRLCSRTQLVAIGSFVK